MTFWSLSTSIGLILMILGFILVAVEMTMPGFSVPGICGTISLIASVFMLANTTSQAICLIIFIFVVLIIMLIIIFKLLSSGKLSSNLVLTEELNKENGYTSSTELSCLLGEKGVANTDLRPSGVGDFNGRHFDVLSEGEYIQKGTVIVVNKVEGSKLIVRVNEK